jgi:hypothetical protein
MDAYFRIRVSEWCLITSVFTELIKILKFALGDAGSDVLDFWVSLWAILYGVFSACQKCLQAVGFAPSAG